MVEGDGGWRGGEVCCWGKVLVVLGRKNAIEHAKAKTVAQGLVQAESRVGNDN